MDPLALSIVTMHLNERDRIWPGRRAEGASARRRVAAALRLAARRLEARERAARLRAASA
ncbi:hypothetical protein [Agrococcus baldri]|uniref:Uncharacterized protein n=1 Tax=Agrococcus baldri TaxID=153730 RepID=A0AA87UTN0_9MICO|nr:hypothetical protein [Agrococcus baldri]GEK81675.1 hypothetical protein ABA31_30260 [Agrococcus baldri]